MPGQDLGDVRYLVVPRFAAPPRSFVVIGSLWLKHHSMYRMIRAYDARLLLLNLRVPAGDVGTTGNRGAGPCTGFVPQVGWGFSKLIIQEDERSRVAIRSVLVCLMVAGIGFPALASPVDESLGSARGVRDFNNGELGIGSEAILTQGSVKSLEITSAEDLFTEKM